jgi:hypothetical protein
MHYCIGARAGKRSLNLRAISQVAPDEIRPGIDRAAMAFNQIIEDCNFVAFIQQKLGANAPDVARAANNENFHAPGKCGAIRLKSK